MYIYMYYMYIIYIYICIFVVYLWALVQKRHKFIKSGIFGKQLPPKFVKQWTYQPIFCGKHSLLAWKVFSRGSSS